MKILLFAVLLVLPAIAADSPGAEALVTACGPDNVKFKVTADAGQPLATQPEPGKALIYNRLHRGCACKRP